VVRVARDNERLQFFLDGEEALFNPIATEIIHLDRYRDTWMLEGLLSRKRREEGDSWEAKLDDVDLVAEYMDVNPLLIPNLLPYVGRFVSGNFENLRVSAGAEGRRRIAGYDIKRGKDISVHEASGSMLSRTVLDMQIAMASLSSRTRPTLLLLNLPLLHLDAENTARYVAYLGSVQFQTIFTSPMPSMVEATRNYGWSAVELKGRAPNCTIECISW
jgi:hypothetical protein